MRSAASLTYEQAQAIEDGADHALAEPVRALFAAYRARRNARGTSARRSISTCPSAASSWMMRARSRASPSASASTRTG
jgi:hypothetical protein